jgi:hypothetical protein
MLVAVVLLLVIAAVAAFVDHRSRAGETQALDACRRELQATAVSSDLQMLAVATTTHGPLASPKGGSALGLAGLMSRSARQLLPGVVHADRVCEEVSVRPWHVGLRHRRDAVTAYSAALAAKLRRIADDGRTTYVEDASLRELRQAAGFDEFDGHP